MEGLLLLLWAMSIGEKQRLLSGRLVGYPVSQGPGRRPPRLRIYKPARWIGKQGG
jgi:hypothetical protein